MDMIGEKRLKSRILVEPVLVGRELELEELMRYLDSVIEGKGSTVFISGEAGSGKTRLTREFLKAAIEKGVGVMAGWCLSDAAVPYFPFVEAFNAYSASFEEEQPINLQHPGAQIGLGGTAQIRSEDQDISALLTGPGTAVKLGKPEALSPQVWKDQAFAAVARTLHSISAQEPIILFLEDIHWADSASLALLQYIARSITSERILVLATFRSEALTADAEGHPHPLAEALRAMGREDLFTEIKIPNLNQTEVSKIAENMIGGNLQPNLAEKLADESRGNPLFIVEALRMLLERKNLILENNEWRLTVDELGIPTKIKDIILRRLAVLKYAQRRVLDAASVIGEKFDAELLASVLGLDALDVLETLNFIAQSTSIVYVEEAFYKFDHASPREVLYEALSLPLKRGYHARVAERLESTNKGGKLPFADLAYHFAHAENKEKAVKYSLAAGQEALARWSNTEAAKHFEYVLQTVGDNPERFAEKTVALEGVGDAFYANNNFSEAAETFEQLAGIQKGVVKLRALRKAMFAAYYQGDIHRLKELTDKAEANATADRLENARVLHQKARVLGIQGQMEASLKLNEEALKVFEEEYALSDAAWSLFVVGYLETSVGQWEKGISSALRSIALYDELGDFRSQMEAYYYVGMCFSSRRLDQEARDNFMKVIEIDDRLKMADYIQLIPTYVYWALSLYVTEDFEGAISKTLKALEYAEKTSSNLYLGSIYENFAVEYTRTGDMVRAEQYFEKLMSLPQEVLSNGFTQGFFGITKATYLAGKNQFEESNRYFNDIFEFIKVASSNLSIVVGLKQAYAWCLSRQGRFEEAKIQVEQAQKLLDSGLEKFSHVNVVASLMTLTRPTVSQTFNLRLDLVNVSRRHGIIVRVENLLIPGLKIVDFPAECIMRNGFVEFKENKIKPFEVKTIKLTLQATKPGVFYLNPDVIYADELGETKTSNPRPFTITIQPAQPKYEVLPGRVLTGFAELDALLFGGIPQNYVVALTASSTDEREMLVKRFLEAGTQAGETTFHITSEAANTKGLAEKYPFNFYLFVCNPQADAMIQSMPNVFKLKGVENLTEIDIALTKAFRALDPSAVGTKRICIEIVSDALLQHHAVTTRRWLSALLPTLKSKGLTTLAVVDPHMHPAEEVQAVLGLFDGEINIYEKETPKGPAKFLKIKRMTNQKYLKDETLLAEE